MAKLALASVLVLVLQLFVPMLLKGCDDDGLDKDTKGEGKAKDDDKAGPCNGVFGTFDASATAVTDASTPGSLMADLFSYADLNVDPDPLIMMHYFPGIKDITTYEERTATFGTGMLASGCVMPGAPVFGKCGKYLVTEYDDCTLPTDAYFTLGGLDLGGVTNGSGIIGGCEDKIVKTSLHCLLRPTEGWDIANYSDWMMSSETNPVPTDCGSCP